MRRSRWWHLIDDEDGLGLIEVMVSIFILGVALLALASVASSSLMSMRITRDREQAINAASAAVEDARSRDFAGMALAPGSVDTSRIPAGALPGPATNACFDGDPIVTDAVVDPLPFHHVAGSLGQIDVYTVITYDDATCPGGRSDLKRVTTIATWQDGGNVRWVTQETLVVAAGRGLPVPRFEIRPEQSSLSFSHAYLSDDAISPKTRCVEQHLRNLGAEDSYEWELVDVTPGSISALGTGDGFRAGDWNVTAYLDFPAQPSLNGAWPPAGDQLVGTYPRFVSDERVLPTETATFTVCYEPAADKLDPGADLWPQDIVATIEVYSRFDDRQVRTLTHQVTVHDQAAPGEALYLFDIDDSNAHPRPKQGSKYLASRMGPLAPTGSDPSLINHLGTINYTQTSASNWSTEIGSNNLPGVRFTRPTSTNRDVDDHTVGWHHQFLAPTTLLPQSTLVLWHAPTNALMGSGLPVGGQPVALEVRVDSLRHNESSVEWPGVATTFTYTHDDTDTSLVNGWKQLEIPIDLGGERAFPNSHYLRLRVTCAPSNTVDCNVAYDNTAHPSAYFVQVK